MDFYTGKELLQKCHDENLPISEIMKIREMTNTHRDSECIAQKLETVLTIMKNAAHKPIEKPGKSIGGLIGGEARKVSDHEQERKSILYCLLYHLPCGYALCSRRFFRQVSACKSLLDDFPFCNTGA